MSFQSSHEPSAHTESAWLPSPDSYLGITVRALWDRSPLILLLGFLFSLCGLPAFILFLAGWIPAALALAALTLGPAWATLIAVYLQIAAGKQIRLTTIGSIALRVGPPGIGLGLIATFPVLAFFLALPLTARPDAPGFVWGSLIVNCWLFGLTMALYLYAVPLLAAPAPGGRRISILHALRCAAALSSRHIANTVGLVGMGMAFALAIGWLSSGLWFVLPGVWAFFIAGHFHYITLTTQHQQR